jgi:hypothetical protein
LGSLVTRGALKKKGSIATLSTLLMDIVDLDDEMAIPKICTKKSQIDGHVEEVAEGYQCRYCSHKPFATSSTTATLRHLKKAHQQQLTGQPKTSNTEKMITKKSFNQETFDRLLMEVIITKDLPFSLVDNAKFKELLLYLKPPQPNSSTNLKILSRTTLMTRLEALFNEFVAKQIAKFETIDSKISITCDLWTSKNILSFLGITAHWLNQDFVPESSLLAFKYFKGRHTGERICKQLLAELNNYGITEKLLGITCDNASNNTKFIEYMELEMKLKHPEAGFSQTWNQVIISNFRLSVLHMLLTWFANKF